ncbi:hypothetical protein EIB18_18720 [Caulobacter vibrioides]|nr:hypothetical protein CA608_20495 [Caulobacter vibrioides]AZH14876.1 hypothetical protein EIB18_18720 [Caulobacter vibrioides]PLR12214.1 hypothetical protein CVUC_08220 [Caulobacter vibrioides]
MGIGGLARLDRPGGRNMNHVMSLGAVIGSVSALLLPARRTR